MGKKCDMDCLNCKYPDCINDRVYPESSLYRNCGPERKQKKIEYSRRKYNEAKAAGICTWCKKKPKQRGLLCNECWIKHHNKYKPVEKTVFEMRREAGTWIRCGGVRVEGHLLCEKHYQIDKANGERSQKHPNVIAAKRQITKYIFGKGR